MLDRALCTLLTLSVPWSRMPSGRTLRKARNSRGNGVPIVMSSAAIRPVPFRKGHRAFRQSHEAE